MKQSVLVLDSQQRSALACTRSLGRHGITVYTADYSASSLAGASRYSKNYFKLPNPSLSPDAYVEKIAALTKQYKITILFPVTDTSIQLILRNKAKLAHLIIPFPDYETYDSVSNKIALFKLANLANVTAPKTYYIDDPDTIPELLTSVNHRLVIKPYKSKIYHDNGIIATEVLLPESNTEIPDLIEQHSWLKSHPFMLQEFVTGFGKGLFALYDRGEPVAYFSHKRLKEKPPEGGVSVLSRAEQADEQLILAADKLLRDKNWHGIAMIEFKINAQGVAYLMEINARFWGSLQLAIDSGVDFPYLLYQIAIGEKHRGLITSKKNNKLRWLLGDFDRLYIILKSSPRKYSFIRKIVEIGKFCIPYSPGLRYEIIRFSDIKPFIFELREYFKALIHRNKD